MKIFSRLYQRVMQWAAHRHAIWYLGCLSFAESSFFPIPPDVMLAPMALARRKSAWWFAMVTTVMSVLGGLFGYAIGAFAFDAVEPLLHQWGYWGQYEMARDWFARWGLWVVFIAGFSPIPYKIFTISAGVAAMPLLPFLLASALGRGARFFMVAGVMVLGGEKVEHILQKYIDRVGWLTVGLAVIVYLALSY